MALATVGNMKRIKDQIKVAIEEMISGKTTTMIHKEQDQLLLIEFKSLVANLRIDLIILVLILISSAY